LAQEVIQTESNLTVDELVKNVFIKGNCSNVTNINGIGDETISIGQFRNGQNVLDFNDGIILSTGAIALAHGPNNSNEASYSFDSMTNDPDLDQLATSDLYDATGIEFDFVPLDEVVTFRYVFASEEYCEFVDSDFNDVFGFFVSGPGIDGPFSNNAINVANLANTNEDVSINTVNHLRNQDFYVNNVTNLDAESCMINFSPLFEDFIEYDGFTTPLTASFRVTPCETYSIRLVIGDVGDPNLDSAVFLETNSFDLGDGVDVRAEVIGNLEPIAYESCIDGQFVFTRSSFSNVNQDELIEFNISPDSEAVNGVDFETIPLSVTIPAGELSFTLPITIIEDNIVEGPENLKLELMYDCDCIAPSVSELIITEADGFSVIFNEVEVCADQAFVIGPQVIGGAPPFDFTWENGSLVDSIEISISSETELVVTVTDFCGNTSEGIAQIGIQSTPMASLTGTYDLCETSSTGIPVLLEGNPPWRIEYAINDEPQIPIENIQSNPFYLATPFEGEYEITAFYDSYCEGDFTGSAEVETSFVVDAVVVPPSCVNAFDGSIEIKEINAISPYAVEWNIEADDYQLIDNLGSGIYILSIVDAEGCLYEKVFDLEAISDLISECVPIYIPNIFSPNQDGDNDVFSIFYEATSGIEFISSLNIYSRWGELIFNQENFTPLDGETKWKGIFKGQPLASGVYVYKIIVVFVDGSTRHLTGDITLIR